MTEQAIVPRVSNDLLQDTTSLVDWQGALTTFLNTLSSPRTAKAYQRAVTEAMEALGVDYVAGITPPMLAIYRGGLVARLDADRDDRLSPATVNLKLAGFWRTVTPGRWTLGFQSLVTMPAHLLRTSKLRIGNSTGSTLARFDALLCATSYLPLVFVGSTIT